MQKQGRFYFDPEDHIYTDHFPGSPVVPGSLIIHAFFTAIKEQQLERSSDSPFIRVEKFRFKKFVVPGEYLYTLVFLKSKVKCSLYDGDIQLAQGIIKLGSQLL